MPMKTKPAPSWARKLNAAVDSLIARRGAAVGDATAPQTTPAWGRDLIDRVKVLESKRKASAAKQRQKAVGDSAAANPTEFFRGKTYAEGLKAYQARVRPNGSSSR